MTEQDQPAGETHMQRMEVAFFNHDSDGSEDTDEAWQKKRSEWASFKKYYEQHAGDTSADTAR